MRIMMRSGPRCALSLLSLILSGSLSSLAAAQVPQYLGQFRALDAAAGDEFGRAVALDGTRGILGAPSRDEDGIDVGAAYIFDALTGQQLQKLVPSDGAEGDGFGTSVAIAGNLAVVGSALDDDAGRSAGAAYVFDVTTGQQLLKLHALDGLAGHEFGVSVDIDHGVILVGAHKDGPGSAYLFDALSGAQLGKLRANDAAPDDLFGVAVALDGGKALIGARYDDDLAIASGAAYIFDVSSQQQLHKLVPFDGARGDRFGMHLDIGGNRAVVGSRYDDDAVKSSGSAYVYDVETGQLLYKLVPKDTTRNDQFGSAVSISGHQVVIGALDDDHNGVYAGSAYLFDVNTGEEQYKFNAIDAAPYDRLGISVAFDGDLVLLGASMVNYPNAPQLPSGKAYVYYVPEPAGCSVGFVGGLLAFVRRRCRAGNGSVTGGVVGTGRGFTI